MSLWDTFETYNPVTLLVGCGFVGAGLWVTIQFALHGKHSAAGIFVMSIFILMPVSVGVAIIHNQLRLRRISKGSRDKRLSS